MPRNWKGKEGELEVVKLLQEWWRRLEPEARFVRTPRSGGWGSTVGPGFKARGDVMVDRETCRRFPFSVEVKWRKEVTRVAIEHFVAGEPSPIAGYWAQCQKAAADDRLRPLLVFRGNGTSHRPFPWRAVWTDSRGRRRMSLLDSFLQHEPAAFAAPEAP